MILPFGEKRLMEKILVLDFGGQYDLLIARRVREQGVFAEIKQYDKTALADISAAGYKGIIFTGGPMSVYEETSPRYDRGILDIGVPVLGICYGHQLIAWMAGGEVRAAGISGEYGKTVRPFNEEAKKKCIGDKETITCRPADLIPDELEKLESEMKEWKQQDEDVLSYALFPQVAAKYFEWRQAQQMKADPTTFNRENGTMPV